MKNYDPKKIVLTFGEILVQGYASGTFVNVEREADAFTKSVGASGDVTRVRNNDQSGTVTITIQAESFTNDLLSAKHAQDELFGQNDAPLMLKDLNGTTLVRASSAWIRKYPPIEYGDDGPTREWMLDCEKLEILVGGALV